VKFQQALPFCVFPASPQLAALHAVSQSSPVPDSCQSCGSYLSTHVTVVRNRQHSRVIATTCNACGRVHSTPLHKGNSATLPSRKQKAGTLHVSSNPIPDANINLPLLSTSQSSFASAPTAPRKIARSSDYMTYLKRTEKRHKNLAKQVQEDYPHF
jgi:hypothetical protein